MDCLRIERAQTGSLNISVEVAAEVKLMTEILSLTGLDQKLLELTIGGLTWLR